MSPLHFESSTTWTLPGVAVLVRPVTFRTSKLPSMVQYRKQQTWGIPMFPTTGTTQVFTPFGSGYVPIQHGDPAHWNLGSGDAGEVREALRFSMFNEILTSLRATLSLK